jgi:nucleoside-diphosphate kinase
LVQQVITFFFNTLDPIDAAPGTIRGDFATEIQTNIIHASDSTESSEKEIKLWFA